KKTFESRYINQHAYSIFQRIIFACGGGVDLLTN
ncbi:MAG: hypothetical protein ACI9D1_001488, partial [Cryomorphaceae bacterium]